MQSKLVSSLALGFSLFCLAPAGAQSTSDARWWSLKPVVKPTVPSIAAAKFVDWSRNPIDAFVFEQLTAKKIEPAQRASRRDLLRRVTFNLTGLPPTPEEMNAFLNDDRPNSWEKVVDRLLASPRYGERWARHWMDVVHFAETHGHDQDVPREHAWPYRDYLIDAFNGDKPYARFVKEQLAGDILYPEDPAATIALGFLAAGPWDESSLRDIREDTIDRTMGQYLDRDDMVSTVGTAFLSTTIQCARCHDHKFDPIFIDEYYGIQAVFAGVDRANRTVDADPKVAARRKELMARKQALTDGAMNKNARLKNAELLAQAQAFEASRRAKSENWMLLDPVRFLHTGSGSAVKQSDGSILFGGARPEKDVYRIEGVVNLDKVTALRLEVLTDDSLPQRGPGRQDNGNLHLNEIEVEVETATGAKRKVVLARATADHNQAGWEVHKAIDGNMGTAWGIFPEVGKPHQAIFVFAAPIEGAKDAKLHVALHQQHGGGHLIGRPRLSITAAAAPTIGPLPADIERILAKPAQDRSDMEQTALVRYVAGAKVDAELGKLPAPRLVYAAASDFKAEGSFRPVKGCRPVHVLKRGDIRRPGNKAKPGGLSLVTALDAKFKLPDMDNEGQRRGAFAEWTASPKNPLTWRSIANRVWHYHIGRGIAATPSDFGRMGAKPSHPELLDWLTSYLLENGGSLKKLHRIILTSETYQQSTRHVADFAKVDADNVYLWRMNRSKLDAESVRDAVLSVSGKLDLKMGGPSVKHFAQSPGIHRTPKVDYDKFDPDAPGAHRRSIYRFIFRTVPDPFLDALDCPDASQFTPARAVSITPLQALALLNDPFMTRMSEHFAKRVESAGRIENQVHRAFEIALGRPAMPREAEILTKHAHAHGMANTCRLLFNLNEFVFLN